MTTTELRRLLEAATPGPWTYAEGGGHAHNSIRGSESVQVSGWPEPRGGITNMSYSERVCENLGDTNLPAPAANAALIAAAVNALPALLDAVEAAKAYRYAGDHVAELEAKQRLDAALAALDEVKP